MARTSDHPPDPALAFLTGGGEMGARMRSHDWNATPLGPPAGWPQSLKSVLSACLNSPQLGVVLWGPELLFLHNDAYIPSLADRHPGAMGRPVSEVWGEAWEQVAPAFHEAVRTGTGFSNLAVPILMTRRGTEQLSWWDFTAAPIRGEDGRVAGLLNQGVEITDNVLALDAQHKAEAALRELNATLELRVAEIAAERDKLWRLSRDPFLVSDKAGRWLSASPVWTEILGWRQEELLGRTSAWMEHPDDHDKTRAKVVTVAEGEVMSSFSNRFRSKAGAYRSFSWSAVADGDRIFCVARDVTHELERAAELEQAREALRQAQKMEAVGQLTGGLAHDFNNLLAAMMGNLELLQVRLARGQTEDLGRHIEAAQTAGRRAAALTQRLLAFSRRQTLDPKPTHVDQLIAGMEDLLRRTLGPANTLEVLGPPSLWTANIDAGQLENALLNLCINARDAMPDGGRLLIETANLSVDPPLARELDLAPGHYLSISVTDNGSGMSTATMARAFEPFFTTKPMGTGTGLGLSMIYGFARQSNGQVRMASELGKGSTFSLYLPRSSGGASPAETANAAPPAAAENGATILLIEDEDAIRRLIDEVLSDAGYTVISAGDGPAGLGLLQSNERVELVITDFGLPQGMNGRQVADAARLLRPGMKILFVTGYAENAAVGNGHLEPGMELLTKPFDLAALEAKVAAMLT